MSTANRIDELRKKFDESPRRYFAPLANELRKAGDHSQAIALCREHLQSQPGHMSGYIVYGQALYESGALDEARAVFEQALTLDAENFIALHHLGHIARQHGDPAAARRWYERALETDPQNEDIIQQLSSLAAVTAPPPAESHASVLPVESGPATSGETSARAMGDRWGEAAVDEPLNESVDAPVVRMPDVVPHMATLDVPDDVGMVSPVSSETIDLLPHMPTPDAAVRAVGLEEAPARLPRMEGVDPRESEPIEGGHHGLPDLELSGGQVPPADAPDELPADEPSPDLPWIAAPVTPSEQVSAIMQALGDDARARGEPDDVALFAHPPRGATEEAPDRRVEAPAFVTETMGELLVSQGMLDRAVAVYEELVRRRPTEPHLTARLAELQRLVAAGAPVPLLTARARFAALASRRVAVPNGRAVVFEAAKDDSQLAASSVPVPPAGEVGLPDHSLASLFGEEPAGDAVAAQAFAEAFSPAPSTPVTPAEFDAALFGVSPRPSVSTPATDAVAQPIPLGVDLVTPAASRPAAAERPQGDFSFDRFFPDPAASVMSTPAMAPAVPPASVPTPRAPAVDPASATDDLAQFSAWLKGLSNT